MQKNSTLRQLKAREREVRRDLIIDAARKVFGTKTYDKVSMQEIANEAGIAKSSIYTYFQNQEDLFVEAAYRDTNRFINELEQRLAGPDDRAAIETLIDEFIEYCTVNEIYWKMITRFSLYGEISNASARKLDVVARRFMDMLDLVFEGEADTEQRRLFSHALFAALSGILIAFRKYPGRSAEESLAHMKKVGQLVQKMFAAYRQPG
ncbi:MAG: TetR/AcrR family transcriptional regulator [Desulfobacterales bacterium]|nr:TetR/AcrR family transcriptional regulator [Desulfobacterales bacterium]MDJ0876111.1 TetR/AcrR family transcriptional regulator [Desulfobacterales bacterium]MDJ0882998.1 TetR/AcrR family transcriptional regulator [Desulfobacterales bacterium]